MQTYSIPHQPRTEATVLDRDILRSRSFWKYSRSSIWITAQNHDLQAEHTVQYHHLSRKRLRNYDIGDSLRPLSYAVGFAVSWKWCYRHVRTSFWPENVRNCCFLPQKLSWTFLQGLSRAVSRFSRCPVSCTNHLRYFSGPTGSNTITIPDWIEKKNIFFSRSDPIRFDPIRSTLASQYAASLSRNRRLSSLLALQSRSGDESL